MYLAKVNKLGHISYDMWFKTTHRAVCNKRPMTIAYWPDDSLQASETK